MDLKPYFERIGYAGRPKADLETLRRLHYLHPCAIPFENLSSLLREPIPLDLVALEDKLIRRRRGGYCFEQNHLFMHALAALGFKLTPLAARVVWNRAEGWINPRTHMALLVELRGKPYLCDVGFGGTTLTAPLELTPGVEQATPHEHFRLVALESEYELEVRLEGGWRAAYRFDLQPQLPIDYEAYNHFVATHPSSSFLSVLMAAKPDAKGRHALAGNAFTRYENGTRVAEHRIESGTELKRLLEREFAIDISGLPALDAVLERIAGGPSVQAADAARS